MTSNDTATPVAVEFRNVNKSYGNGPLVLNEMSLHIEPGELVTVLGPSGCGKTTSLRILAGFETANGGDVLVDGKSILGVPASKRHMGMVFQSYSLFPNLSVADNIEYGLRIRRKDAQFRAERTSELLEVCGLPGFGDRFPHQLSGGQQQRVALARALAIAPRVLLLDEPLSALDAAVRANLRDEIRRVQKQLGTTTMFITHDQAEALVIADRVAVMNGGKVEQFAPPNELYARPATPFVARFVGTINEFAVPHGWQPTQPIPLEHPGDDEIAFVRPENLRVERSASAHAVVSDQNYLGDRVQLRIAHPHARGGAWIVLINPGRASEFPVGTAVSLSLAGEVALRLPSAQVDR